MKNYIKLRDEYPSNAAFGQWLAKNHQFDRWKICFLEMAKFCMELDFTPTARVDLDDKTSHPMEHKVLQTSLSLWCDQNLEGRHVWWSETTILFENRDDAMRFKLTWI